MSKDGGNDVGGVGRIPEHWIYKRGRFCIRVNPASRKLRRLAPYDEVSFLPMEAIGEYGGLSLDQTISIADATDGYTQFEDRDVVVAKITPCFENRKGALAKALTNGMAFGTTELHVLRPGPEVDPSFLFFVTISPVFRERGEAEMYGAGGQKRIPAEFIKNFRIPIPPLREQRRIAEFLEGQTRNVDSLVTKKRLFIAMLREKRRALVSSVLTRGLPPKAAVAAGLNPKPKMTMSGIDWLGEIPEHWTVNRLGNEMEFISYGFTNPMPTTDDGPFMVTANDIGSGKVLLSSARRTSTEDFNALTRKSKPRRRDILVTKDGTLGRVAVVDFDSDICINQSVALLRPKQKTNEHFVAYALQERPYSDRMLLEAGGTTIRHIYVTRLARMPIALPPLKEQHAITQFLANAIGKIDALIAKVEKAIEQLTEFRESVVAAAVTGSTDLRVRVAKGRFLEIPNTV